MHEHPTQGVKSAKPRLSSKPGPQIGKLSEEYLKARNRQMHAKATTAEMEGAARRGELISLKHARLQLSYLLTVLRQHLLAVPAVYGPRLVGLSDEHEASAVLREMALALLGELQDLPYKVTDPRWIESLGGQEEADGAAAEPKRSKRKPTA